MRAAAGVAASTEITPAGRDQRLDSRICQPWHAVERELDQAALGCQSSHAAVSHLEASAQAELLGTRDGGFQHGGPDESGILDCMKTMVPLSRLDPAGGHIWQAASSCAAPVQDLTHVACLLRSWGAAAQVIAHDAQGRQQGTK